MEGEGGVGTAGGLLQGQAAQDMRQVDGSSLSLSAGQSLPRPPPRCSELSTFTSSREAIISLCLFLVVIYYAPRINC